MNTFGRVFRVSVFGESHGEKIGAVLDGVPAGIELSVEDFAADLARRKSGAKGTTPRTEADLPMLVSGVFNGRTTGAPLTILFANENVRSEDYSQFVEHPRPGHADLTGAVKFSGFNDPRGGGHFSGRLTAVVVAAGVVAKKVLEGVSLEAKLVELGGEKDEFRWSAMLDEAIAQGDSLGAVVECRAGGVPAGLGEPFFDSVESVISHTMFAVPGVRGVEFGDGFAAAAMKGSEHNDMIISEKGETSSNGAGGVNGGISNGNDLVFRLAFKPTSTIRKEQNTYNFKSGQMENLAGKGRHDVCFALRTPAVVEAMTAIVLADFWGLQNR
jgi:chorismate synthase